MKTSFIGGLGNMATAMIQGILKSGLLTKEDIFISDETENNQQAVDCAEIIFLCVKPQLYNEVITNLKNTEGKVFVSVAPGITIQFIEERLKGAKVIRTMPNTPARVLEGVTAVCRGKTVTGDELDFVKKLLSSFSQVFEFEEKYIDSVIALSGSSPAYVFKLINAMAKYSEGHGIAYDIAVKMAAQSVLGAAKLLLESNEPPESLIKKVCSRGGTTEKAIEKMDELNFDNLIEKAMDACTKRAQELII